LDQVLVEPVLLEPPELSCGQESVFPALFELELELPLPFAVELAEGDAVCANAWVTPTPPIATPLASAAARAALRRELVISITSFSLETQHIERS
jgi:hypothetical protein